MSKTIQRNIKSYIEEFNSREIFERFRNGLRVQESLPDIDIILKRLAEDLSFHRRRCGFKIKDVSIQGTVFDWGFGCGVAYKALVEKDPNASPLVYVCDKYARIARNAREERDEMLSILKSVVRCKSIASIRKRIKKVTG